MKKSIVFLALFVCLVFLISAQAQKKGTTSVDVRIVKNRPNVFISYERIGKREPQDVGDSDEGVWLRFHNNSRWQVGVCMFDVSKENGDVGFNYEVERYENAVGEETPVANDPEGSCSIGLIRPGKSLVFSVPREHLADGLAIRLRFRYEWESDTNTIAGGGREPFHFAYFYSLDIPKSKLARR
jgi:hypothetical protein